MGGKPPTANAEARGARTYRRTRSLTRHRQLSASDTVFSSVADAYAVFIHVGSGASRIVLRCSSLLIGPRPTCSIFTAFGALPAVPASNFAVHIFRPRIPPLLMLIVPGF